jgi:hypothetical protein
VLNLVSASNAVKVVPVTTMFRSAVPHAELVVIDDTDHNMRVMTPAPVAVEISEFLGHNPM